MGRRGRPPKKTDNLEEEEKTGAAKRKEKTATEPELLDGDNDSMNGNIDIKLFLLYLELKGEFTNYLFFTYCMSRK